MHSPQISQHKQILPRRPNEFRTPDTGLCCAWRPVRRTATAERAHPATGAHPAAARPGRRDNGVADRVPVRPQIRLCGPVEQVDPVPRQGQALFEIGDRNVE